MSESNKAEDGKKKVSRRDFLAGGGAAVAIGAAGAVGAAGTSAASAPKATTTSQKTGSGVKWDYETDVLVVGSGNGGLSAAVAAAKGGAKVIVVEISTTTGGGSSFSGGGIHIWGQKTYEEYLAYTDNLQDPVMGKAFYDNFTKYTPWLKEIGAAVSKSALFPNGKHDIQMGRNVSGPPYTHYCREYFDSLVSILEKDKGRILLKTKAEKLLTDEDGTVIGLKAKGPAGQIHIKAKRVILACGGFQANAELRMKYLGREADLATIQALPYQKGDGMAMAKQVGAALGGSMSTFSATWMSAHPARNPAEDRVDYEKRPYTPAGKYELFDLGFTFLPPGMILVNLQGKRFVNEEEKYYRVPQAVIKQRRATAIMICDDAMFGPWADVPSPWGSGKTPREQLELMTRYGGALVKANTIEELADKLANLSPHRVHKANLLKTIEEYNKAAAVGKTDELEVPKSFGTGKQRTIGDFDVEGIPPIANGPFYAWPLRPAIYCCYGGVKINEHAQVLDLQDDVIAGLYAAPPVAGGVFREIYTGGISLAGTFGFVAGKHAAASI